MTKILETNAPAGRYSPASQQLLEQASAIAPLVGARASAAEALQRLPDENIAELNAAGLFRILQPKRLGGYQASLHDFIDAVAEVGKGCGATAWVLGVVNAHHWLLGLFEKQAQDDVLASKSDFVITAVIGPRGKARAVEGGYQLDGFWPFCSGSPAADWLMLGGEIVDDNGAATDQGDFLIPASSVEVMDDWNTSGLRGTGSNSVAVKKLFVPRHRYLSLVKAIGGENPGAALHDTQLYAAAIVPVLALGLVPAALGIAEGTLELFKQRLPGKIVSYTFGEAQIGMPVTHMQVAEAASKIDAARMIMHRAATDIERAANAKKAMTLAQRARCRMDCAYGVRQCLEAVEILFLASGGSSLSVSNPIQRASRDLHAIAMHGLLCLETNKEMYGRILLGLEQNSPII